MNYRKYFLFLASALACLSGPAFSAVIGGGDCASVNGQSVQTSPSEAFFVTLNPGDTLTITDSASGTQTGLVSPATPSTFTVLGGVGGPTTGASPFTFVAPNPGGSFQITAQATDVSLPFAAMISCSAAVVVPAAPGETDVVPLVTGLAQGAQDAMVAATGTALRRRWGGPGVQVTRNSGFLSTRGQGAGPAGWAYASVQSFNGDMDGSAATLLLGADVDLGSNLFAGAMLGYGKIDITHAGNDQDGKALSFGIYAGQTFETLSWTAFAAYAKPEYRSGAASFTTERMSFGATVEGRVAGDMGTLYPFATVSAWEEKVPDWALGMGQDIRRTTATLGARYEWAPRDNGLTPWASFGLDYASRTSRTGGDESFVRPRAAVGFTQSFDNGGQLNLGVDLNWVEQNSRALALKLDYTLTF